MLIKNIKFFVLEKVQHEKEIPFDEIDISNRKRSKHQNHRISHQEQVR